MASGGQTGGFGNMGGQQYGQQGSIDTFPVFNSQSGSQPSMAQQSMGQQSMGGYDPRMFGNPYTPPPPPAPTPAPQAPSVFPFFGAQSGGQQYGQNPFMSLYQQRQQQSTQPAPPFQPSLGPGGRDALYQTPDTPMQGYRPSSQAPQFYQPIYRSQYQDYNMGNPFGVSMYGNPFMGGTGEIGIGDFMRDQLRGRSPFMGRGMGFNPYGGMGFNPYGGMSQQAPSFMQSALTNMLQQQQAGRGGALPTASQSDINQQHFLAQQQAGPQGLVASPMDTLRIQANQARRAQMSPDQLAAEDAQAAQQSQQSMSALQNLFAGKPVGGQSGMTSALGSLAGGLPMSAMMAKGGIASLIKK